MVVGKYQCETLLTGWGAGGGGGGVLMVDFMSLAKESVCWESIYL